MAVILVFTLWKREIPIIAIIPECVCSSLNHVWFCDPMDCGTPGFPVLHYLPEFAHFMYTESVMLSNHLILCHPLHLPSIFPSIPWSFPVSWFFASGGQRIWASASVLPMNIWGWFPLGLTGLISLLSKGLSRVFSSTTIWKHQYSIVTPFKSFTAFAHT